MAATKISTYSGDRQRSRIKTGLSNALVALVTDALDAPVSGVTVTFQVATVPQGATGQSLTGNVQTIDVDTDALGLASVVLTLGSLPGSYLVSATATGLTGSPLTFTEVATPANAIISIDEVKHYLKLDGTMEQDDFLQGNINTASDEIERFIRRPVVVQEYPDEILDGNSSRAIYPHRTPIVGLLTNTVDGAGKVNDILWRTTPLSDWITFIQSIKYVLIDPNRPWKIQLWAWAFPEGTQNIKVSYRAGYDPIPGALSQVCLERAVEVYKESNWGDASLKRDSVAVTNQGGVSGTTRFKDLSDGHKKLLLPFRRPIV